MRKYFGVRNTSHLVWPKNLSLFYLIAVGIGICVLVEQGSGTNGTNGIKYIAFIAPALLANTAITGIMDETIFPTIEQRIQTVPPLGDCNQYAWLGVAIKNIPIHLILLAERLKQRANLPKVVTYGALKYGAHKKAITLYIFKLR